MASDGPAHNNRSPKDSRPRFRRAGAAWPMPGFGAIHPLARTTGLTALLLLAALAAALVFSPPAHAQDDEDYYVDVALILEASEFSLPNNRSLKIIVKNLGSRTAYDVEVVVNIVMPTNSTFFPSVPKVPIGTASLGEGGYSFSWTIPELRGYQRVEVDRTYRTHSTSAPVFNEEEYPHLLEGEVETASFESDLRKGNNSDRVWSVVTNDHTWRSEPALPEYSVNVSVDELHPSPGDVVNFTVTANHSTRTIIDLKVAVELTDGLVVDEDANADPPRTITYDPAQADTAESVGYSGGVFNIGTLNYSEWRSKHSVTLPIKVALNAVVNDQCLTATITGDPPPEAGPRDDDMTDNVAKLCLGDQLAEPFASGQVDAFTVYPCVGITTSPCVSTDDVRVRAVDKTISPERILSAGEATINIVDAPGRTYDGQMHNSVLQSVNSADEVSWQTATDADPDFVGTRKGVKIGFTRGPFNDHLTSWTKMGLTVTVEGADGNPPGTLHIRNSANGRFLFALNSGNSWTGSVGPFNLTSAQNAPAIWSIEFEKLGLYTMEFSVQATHATESGDCDTDGDNSNDAFCASETYTFHVGPMRDLAVEDGGASPHVAADQHALTIVPVNNGPDHSPGATVTGLPTGAEVLHVSQGNYDSAAGEWNIGELKVRGYYRSAGEPEPTLILSASASDTASVSIASAKNYEVCIGGKDNPGDLAHTTKEACEADTATGVSWHSTPVYDWKTGNNTATITAVQGTGGVGAATVENTTLSITIQWDPVEYVLGIPVAHYEIQWSADGSTGWTTSVSQVMGTLYVDTEPQAGDTRHYRVRPVNQAGVAGPWTAVSSATATASTVTPPGKPTGLTATVSTVDVSDIVLTWTAPMGMPDATSYDIQISEDGITDWQPLINNVAATPTSYTHSNVGYDVTRHYRVRALETNGQPGEWSDTDSATTENPAPLAPANLSALPNGLDGIIVAWDAADRNGGAPITHYEVEWSADGNTNWTSLNNNVSGTSIVDTAPTDGTTRYYRARAVNATGLKSPDSNTDSATAATAVLDPPGTPTALTATVSNVSGILLTWTAPTGTPPAARYEIDYSANGNDPWTPLVNNVTSTSHTHSNVGFGVTRHYRVRAVNSEGLAGEWSSTDDATTDNPAPLAPTGVEALPNGLMGLVVFWDAASRNQGAPITHYEVQWSADGNDPWTTLTSNVAGTSHIDTAPAADVTRHYRVRAVNATSLMSPWSDSDSATAIREALAAPGEPTGLSAAVSNVSDILLSWTAATDGVPVARYEIEYSADDSTDWKPLANNVASTATGYTDNGADYGETRHYRIRAVNTEGLEGDWSDTADATTENPRPGVPTNVMAVAQGLTGIIVSWNPPAAYQGKPVTHYEVEVSPDGNNPWTSRDDSITSNVYTHTGLSANDTRHYRVYAYNSAGRSAASSVVTVTIPTALQGATAGPPGVPVVTAQPNGRTEIVLRWNKPVENGSPIISYDVEVSERRNGEWTDAEAELTGTSTSWTHTGLIGNTTRYYRVRAENHIDDGRVVGSGERDHAGTGPGRRAPEPAGRTGRGQRHRPVLGPAGRRRGLAHHLLPGAVVPGRHGGKLAQRGPDAGCGNPHLQGHRAHLRHHAALPGRRPQQRDPGRLVSRSADHHAVGSARHPQPHRSGRGRQHHRADVDRAGGQRRSHHRLRNPLVARRLGGQLELADRPRRSGHLTQRLRPRSRHPALLPHPGGEQHRRGLVVHGAQRGDAASGSVCAHAAGSTQRRERHQPVVGPAPRRRRRGHQPVRAARLHRRRQQLLPADQPVGVGPFLQPQRPAAGQRTALPTAGAQPGRLGRILAAGLRQDSDRRGPGAQPHGPGQRGHGDQADLDQARRPGLGHPALRAPGVRRRQRLGHTGLQHTGQRFRIRP